MNRYLFKSITGIWLVLVAVVIPAVAHAQLSEIKVVDVFDAGENPNPKLDRLGDKMALIEVVSDHPEPELRILQTVYVEPGATSDDGLSHYGHAAAASDFMAKYISIYHPDCLPLNLQFDDFEATKELKGDRIYRVVLAFPSAKLTAANKAFSDLDLDMASRLYGEVDDAGEKKLAESRLALLGKVAPSALQAEKYENAQTETGKTRAMMLYDNIFRQTGSIEARRRYQRLKWQLLPDAREGESNGISEIIITGFRKTDGLELRTEKDLDIPVDERPRYALIIMTIPLDNVKIADNEMVVAQLKKDGEYWVVVKTGNNAGNKTLSLRHPNFKTLDVCFGKDGIPELENGITYRMDVSAPPAAFVEGDMYFNDMEFDVAAKIYASVDTTGISTRESALLGKRLENCVVLRPYAEIYDRLRPQVNSPGKLIDRNRMINMIDTVLSCLDIMGKEGVETAKQLSADYRDLRDSYKERVHICLEAYKEEKGNRIAPFSIPALYVEIKSDSYPDGVVLKAGKIDGKKGIYSLFLPSHISKELLKGKKLSLVVGDNPDMKGDSKSDKLSLKGGEGLNYELKFIVKK